MVAPGLRRHSLRHHNHDHRHADHRFARDPIAAGERFDGRHRHSRDHRVTGRRRIFDHGDLRFILLSMIAAKPAHGYDLIKALEDRMGGGYSPSPGVIYPTLTMLEEQGYASVTAADGKKLYQATEDGVAFLRANQVALDAIQNRIDEIARERSVVPDPRIIRAIENLKTALRLRLAPPPEVQHLTRVNRPHQSHRANCNARLEPSCILRDFHVKRP